jgi:hypothetical protein
MQKLDDEAANVRLNAALAELEAAKTVAEVNAVQDKYPDLAELEPLRGAIIAKRSSLTNQGK